MPLVNSLVPSRFLTLLAHLVIVLTILFSRDTNVIASLPPDYLGSQFYSQDAEFILAIALTLVAFLIELSGFFTGISMFNNTQSLLSVGAHASASITLLFFLFDQWPSDLYWWIFVFCSACVSLSLFVSQEWECRTFWYIFGFCSAFPALVELGLILAVLRLGKKPL